MAKSTRKNKEESWKSLEGDFIPDKSADIIIEDLKNSRTFTRGYDPIFVSKVLDGEKAKEHGEKGLGIDVETMWDAEPKAKSDKLPAHVLKSIEIGLKQIEDGQTISWDEFKKRHFRRK